MAQIIFLGTGASGGTPGSGKSKRLESSILIKDKLNILIDVTRDFPVQARGPEVDAVLLTHGHKDACGGINKLPPNIIVFSHTKTFRLQPLRLTHKFKLVSVRDGQTFKLGSLYVTSCKVPHAKDPRFPTFAWKIKGLKTIVYASDVAELTEKFKRFCEGADILIIDGATYKRTIFTHLRVDLDLPKLCRWNVNNIILTQIGKSAPKHEEFVKEVRKICPKAMPAFDGMRLAI